MNEYKLTTLDKLAYDIYVKDCCRSYYSVYGFINLKNIDTNFCNKYYTKAKIELRKSKLSKLSNI